MLIVIMVVMMRIEIMECHGYNVKTGKKYFITGKAYCASIEKLCKLSYMRNKKKKVKNYANEFIYIRIMEIEASITKTNNF